jgi:hypothetical protein
VLFVIAMLFAVLRLPAVGASETASASNDSARETPVWSHRHLVLGVRRDLRLRRRRGRESAACS